MVELLDQATPVNEGIPQVEHHLHAHIAKLPESCRQIHKANLRESFLFGGFRRGFAVDTQKKTETESNFHCYSASDKPITKQTSNLIFSCLSCEALALVDGDFAGSFFE